MFKHYLYLFFFSISISTKLIAQANSAQGFLGTEIIDSYKLLLTDKVFGNLLTNHKKYKESPNKYWRLLEATFFENWDFDATTRALIGNEIFNSLSESQFNDLSKTLQVTLIRYAFECLSLYGGQRINVIDINVNEQQTFAWLKMNMESPRLPDIHLDLLLIRRQQNHWKGADFRFKGITYVNLKKNAYRQDFKELRFQGLLRKLEVKNKVFFNDLCQSEANYIDPQKPPCF